MLWPLIMWVNKLYCLVNSIIKHGYRPQNIMILTVKQFPFASKYKKCPETSYVYVKKELALIECLLNNNDFLRKLQARQTFVNKVISV